MTDSPNGAVLAVDTEQPVIDLAELSWGDTKAMVAAAARLSMIGDGTISEIDAQEIAHTLEALEALIAPIIISIPRSWLVKRAPEQVDYVNGGLNWLRRGKFMELANYVTANAQRADEEAKN